MTPNGHGQGILLDVVRGAPPALMLLPAMTRPSSLVLDVAGVSTATHNPLPALPWVGVISNNEGRDPGLSFQHEPGLKLAGSLNSRSTHTVNTTGNIWMQVHATIVIKTD